MYLHKLKFEFQRKGTRISGRKSKSFQGPKGAMDPSQYLLTSLSQLCQLTEQQSFEKCFWASQANPGKACLSHTKYFYDVKGFGWDLYNKYWVGDHPEGRILPINWNFQFQFQGF